MQGGLCAGVSVCSSHTATTEKQQQVRFGVPCRPCPFPASWDLRGEESPPLQALTVVVRCEKDVPGRLEDSPRSCYAGPPALRDSASRGISCWSPSDPCRGPHLDPGPAWSYPARMTDLPCPVALQGSSKAVCQLTVQPPTPIGEGPGFSFPALATGLVPGGAGLLLGVLRAGPGRE